MVFDAEGDKFRNKRIEDYITVSVVIDMECGNTKKTFKTVSRTTRGGMMLRQSLKAVGLTVHGSSGIVQMQTKYSENIHKIH